jgi:beta-glucanase (GH16 family)
MSFFLFLVQAVTLGATDNKVDQPLPTPVGRPAFVDEFDGRRVDGSNWRFDTARNATGWFNNERQYYSASRAENARVEKGALIIEARREKLAKARFPDWGGQDYTSARLVSRKALGFGFYEIRAKLPCGRGIWPAIWMLPAEGKWPDAGEIDIMEMVGWDANVIHATVHSAAFNHRLGTQRGAQKRVATSCTRFHRYQLEWKPDSILIGIDGRAHMRVANDQPGGAAAWPFTRHYQLILNVAVGGDWGGQKGIDDRAFPQRMVIDYVRYWDEPRVGQR